MVMDEGKFEKVVQRRITRSEFETAKRVVEILAQISGTQISWPSAPHFEQARYYLMKLKAIPAPDLTPEQIAELLTPEQIAELRAKIRRFVWPLQPLSSLTVQFSVMEEVPALGERILYYSLSPDRLEAILGDLEEAFQRYAAKHGRAAARRWYYWQVIRTAFMCGLNLLGEVAKILILFRPGPG